MISFWKNLFLASIVLASGLAFLFATPASAQETSAGLRLITSPLPINLTTTPGSTASAELRIKNGGTADETLKIDLMKFRAYEDSGKPELMDPEPGDDFLAWVTFSEPTFTLGPNEWKTVTATFQVPSTASFGYYYAFVFSRAGEDEKISDRQETVIVGGTAVLVLLEVTVADAKREVEVAEFSTDRKVYEFLPARFNVKLKNTGNVHIAPRGNIFIGRGDTSNIALLEVNGEKGNILPNSNRVFEADWSDGFPVYQAKTQDDKAVLDENGQAVYQLVWDWNDASKLRFGKYTAKMLLIYDNGSRHVPIEGEVSFWVVPWRILLVLLVVVLFFFIGFRSAVMHLWHRVFKQKQADI